MSDGDRLFAFRLALKLGFPHPDDLIGSLTEAQLHEWKTWLEANYAGFI
jgi:hypothetical protein